MSEVLRPTPEQCHEAARFCARTYSGGIDEAIRSRVHFGITSLLGLHDVLGSEYFALGHMVGLLAMCESNHQDKTARKAGPVTARAADAVNHPAHYTGHPSGVECITIAEHFGFCMGNAIKYIWRAGEKGNALEDLKKARWYLDREIARSERAASPKGG